MRSDETRKVELRDKSRTDGMRRNKNEKMRREDTKPNQKR